MLNSGTLSPQSSYLTGGMEPHSLSTNLASVSRPTVRLAAIGLRPFDVGRQGDCFFLNQFIIKFMVMQQCTLTFEWQELGT